MVRVKTIIPTMCPSEVRSHCSTCICSNNGKVLRSNQSNLKSLVYKILVDLLILSILREEIISATIELPLLREEIGNLWKDILL